MEKNHEKSNQETSVNVVINAETLKRIFQKSADVQFQEYTFKQRKVMLITCDAMVDRQFLNDVIIERVQLFFQALEENII